MTFASLEEVDRIRKDSDLVNNSIKELYNITSPIYEKLPDRPKNSLKEFLSSLYRDAATAYHKIVMGNLVYISDVSRKKLEDYVNSNSDSAFSNPDDDLLKLVRASYDLREGTSILQTLSMKILDVYEILTGIKVREIIDGISENCPDIKAYTEGFKKTDAFYTILYSMLLNSARVYSHSILEKSPFAKDIVKSLASNTLASILPTNNEDLRYEKLVMDDDFLEIVYKNIDVVFSKLVTKVDSRFSEKELEVIKSIKEAERRSPDYLF